MLIHLVNTGCRSYAHPPNSRIGLIQAQECFLQKATLYKQLAGHHTLFWSVSILWPAFVQSAVTSCSLFAVFYIFPITFSFVSDGFLLGSTDCSLILQLPIYIFWLNVSKRRSSGLGLDRYCDSVDSWTWVEQGHSFHSIESEAFFGWVERVVDSVDVVIGDKEAEVEGEVDLKS